MKKLLLLFMFVLVTQYVALSNDDSQFIVALSKYRDKKPDKGHRIPEMKEVCTIDFVTRTIQTSIAECIIFYQVWDDTGQTIEATYSNEYDMVTFMISLSGSYQIRLISENDIFIGYLDI